MFGKNKPAPVESPPQPQIKKIFTNSLWYQKFDDLYSADYFGTAKPPRFCTTHGCVLTHTTKDTPNGYDGQTGVALVYRSEELSCPYESRINGLIIQCKESNYTRNMEIQGDPLIPSMCEQQKAGQVNVQ